MSVRAELRFSLIVLLAAVVFLPARAASLQEITTDGASSSPQGQQATSAGQSARPAQAPSQSQANPAEPQMPKTEILDSSATSGALESDGDGHDPILDPPPFPRTTTTMVGGIIRHVDRVRNRLVIGIFSGDDWTVHFDERTHIFENGAETTQLALHKGQRVYVDTMADEVNHNILARNIRLGVSAPPADADGQIESVDLEHGEVSLLDRIGSVPVHFGVTAATRIIRGATPATLADVKPGALVHVKFLPQNSFRGVARQITVIATPGTAFTFRGEVSYLDMHRGLLAVRNQTDGRTYDIHFYRTQLPNAADLGVGELVTVIAVFDGPQYTARSVAIHGRVK